MKRRFSVCASNIIRKFGGLIFFSKWEQSHLLGIKEIVAERQLYRGETTGCCNVAEVFEIEFEGYISPQTQKLYIAYPKNSEDIFIFLSKEEAMRIIA